MLFSGLYLSSFRPFVLLSCRLFVFSRRKLANYRFVVLSSFRPEITKRQPTVKWQKSATIYICMFSLFHRQDSPSNIAWYCVLNLCKTDAFVLWFFLLRCASFVFQFENLWCYDLLLCLPVFLAKTLFGLKTADCLMLTWCFCILC